MASNTEKDSETTEFQHTPNPDNQLRQQVEMADTTSRICVTCTCGLLHEVLTNDSIDTHNAYDETVKEFKPIETYQGTVIFRNKHPYFNGKL